MPSNTEIPGRNLIRVIIATMLLISASITAMYVVNVGTEKLPQQVTRFGLTCVICWKLYQGKSWARWLTVFLLSLGLLLGVLTSGDGMPFILYGMFGAYGAIVVALVFGPDMTDYFDAFLRRKRELDSRQAARDE